MDKKIGSEEKNIGEVPGQTLESMLPCWALFTLPHISYHGYLSACYCEHDYRFYMADLKTMDFKDAWHSIQLVELRRKHLFKKMQGSPCEGCIAYEH